MKLQLRETKSQLWDIKLKLQEIIFFLLLFYISLWNFISDDVTVAYFNIYFPVLYIFCIQIKILMCRLAATVVLFIRNGGQAVRESERRGGGEGCWFCSILYPCGCREEGFECRVSAYSALCECVTRSWVTVETASVEMSVQADRWIVFTSLLYTYGLPTDAPANTHTHICPHALCPSLQRVKLHFKKLIDLSMT